LHPAQLTGEPAECQNKKATDETGEKIRDERRRRPVDIEESLVGLSSPPIRDYKVSDNLDYSTRLLFKHFENI